MNIFESINKVMAQIGFVGKNDKNDQQHFMYRGIDAVMNALNPALIANKVFIVPEILEQTREERTTSKGGLLIYSICKIKFKFYAEDGTSVEAVTVGEGMDSGDKATNKAMSVAFKYACFQVFCIPTEELMAEQEAESHEVSPKETAKETKKETPKETKKEAPKVTPKEEPIGKDPGDLPLAPGCITGNQKTQILHEINRTQVNKDEVCSRYKIETIDDLPAVKFEKLISLLRSMESR